jgi:hypothetical protein
MGQGTGRRSAGPHLPPGPEALYDILAERYERGSILLTSNRASEEWPELSGERLLAAAGLDRRPIKLRPW